MNAYVKLGVILFLISAIFSGMLAFVNKVTAPKIAANKEQTAIEARMQVLPDAKSFDQKNDGDFVYFVARNDSGKAIGYVFTARKRGYSSTVETMVGVDDKFVIKSIKVLNQAETPGLGDKYQKYPTDKDPLFAKQFPGKTLADMKVVKDGGPITTFSGATITGRTITNSINEALEHLSKLEVCACPTDSTRQEAIQ
jgi:Na+-translocating ferredoxin:NAD+ oxidoreductase subunit G